MSDNEGKANGQEPEAESITDAMLPSMKGYVAPIEGTDDDEWVAEDAIAALSMEKRMNPAETNEEVAERIFDENLPVAAQAICYLALYAGNTQVRFGAAKYVVERKLGKVTDPDQARKGGKDPLLDFMGEVTMSQETYDQIRANAGVSADAPE